MNNKKNSYDISFFYAVARFVRVDAVVRYPTQPYGCAATRREMAYCETNESLVMSNHSLCRETTSVGPSLGFAP